MNIENTSQHKYCYNCGQELVFVRVEQYGYSRTTGKPLPESILYACPKYKAAPTFGDFGPHHDQLYVDRK